MLCYKEAPFCPHALRQNRCVCERVCEREMSEFGGVGVGKELLVLPKFLIPTFPLIGVLACVYVCVCLYVQALISAFCLVCIPTLHKTLPFHQADNNRGRGGRGLGCCWKRRKLIICKSFNSIVSLKVAQRQLYQTLTLKCHVCLWVCSVMIRSFVVLDTPETVRRETRTLNGLPERLAPYYC